MNTGLFVTAGLFCLIGLISTINPMFAFNLRARSGRQVMDMEIQPGARTLLAYRLLGIAFIVIGAGMLFVELR
ncbi:MAG TPA: hypothetical protein VI451_22850 [Anaerolineales bacterium]|nr:hypothetical protein [Anaerolineales bacterium]